MSPLSWRFQFQAGVKNSHAHKSTREYSLLWLSIQPLLNEVKYQMTLETKFPLIR